VTIIACADWIINKKCKKSYQNEKNIVAFARQAVSKTNLHIVLALKAYEKNLLMAEPRPPSMTLCKMTPKRERNL
jgi:hypothetical protein